jgi:hypothetical protein
VVAALWLWWIHLVSVVAAVGPKGPSHHLMVAATPWIWSWVTPPPPSGSLSLDLGAGVLMGLPCALTWIRTIYLGAGLSSESSTEKISMGVFIIFFIIIGIPFSSLPLSQ